MKNYITIVFISTLTLSVHSAIARETVISAGVSSGLNYSDRSYDEDSGEEAEGVALPPDILTSDDASAFSGVEPNSTEGDTLPPPDGMGMSRDDERSDIFITPHISIISEGANDIALLEYRASVSYDLIEDETNDINHEASAGYRRNLTDNWDLKIYDIFKNTDDYETNRPMEESLSDTFIEELATSIPTLNETLRDESGRRRYTRNQLSTSTGFNYMEGGRVSLGYDWDHLEYDKDETESGSYQNYDKYNVNMALSYKINSIWTFKGRVQFVRGVFDSDDTSDNDLNEYQLGGLFETEIIPSHPITLSYDFSQTDYDDDSTDTSQIHNLTLRYQLFSSPELNVILGGGPTYSKYNDSEDSWDGNGNLDISYRIGRGSLRLSSDVGTQFDNFSGTDESALTNYWQSRVEFDYPINRAFRTGLYCGYRDETRNEIDSDTEIDVEKISMGGILKYKITDDLDTGLGYDFTMQDSDNSADSYDEHRIQLMLSYKTDLLKW